MLLKQKFFFFFFFNYTATTSIYTLSLHDALPISPVPATGWRRASRGWRPSPGEEPTAPRPPAQPWRLPPQQELQPPRRQPRDHRPQWTLRYARWPPRGPPRCRARPPPPGWRPAWPAPRRRRRAL